MCLADTIILLADRKQPIAIYGTLPHEPDAESMASEKPANKRQF